MSVILSTESSRKRKQTEAMEALEAEKRAKAHQKLLKKTAKSSLLSGTAVPPAGNKPPRSSNKGGAIAAIKASSKTVATKSAVGKDPDIDFDNFSNYSNDGSLAQEPVYNYAEELEKVMEAKVAADLTGGTTMWPRKADLQALVSGIPATQPILLSPNNTIFTDSVGRVKVLAAQDMMIYADVKIGPASDGEPGTIFVVFEGPALDLLPHFYQIMEIPVSRDVLRRATIVMSGVTDPVNPGSPLSIDELKATIFFSPHVQLCYVSVEVCHQIVAYLSKEIRFAPDNYWAPIVDYEETGTGVPEEFRQGSKIPDKGGGQGGDTLSVVPRPQRPESLRAAKSKAPEDLQEAYIHASKMYKVPSQLITQSALLASREEKSSIAQELTSSLGYTGTRGKDSMEKQGLALNPLFLLSVAPLGTFRMSWQELQANYFNRAISPISPKRLVSGGTNFSVGNRGRDLRYYRNLQETYGHGSSLVQVHGRRYADMKDVSEDSVEFTGWLAGEDGKFVSMDLDVVEDAVHNLMLLIFISHSMRYKFQHAFLEAVKRLFTFLRYNDLGPKNPSSEGFIYAIIAEFFASLEAIRVQMLGCRDTSDEDLFLKHIAMLPETEEGSPIADLREHFRRENSGSMAKMLLEEYQFNGSSATDSATKEEKEDMLRRNKEKKATKVAKKKAAAELAKALAASNNAGKPADVGNPSSARMVCAHYCSSVGCIFSEDKCFRKHFIPKKQSAEWKRVDAFHKERNLQPSKSFLEAK